MINEGTVKIIMVKVVNVELEFYLPCASFSVLSSNLKHSGPLGQPQLDGNTERASVAEAEFDSQSQSISQGSSWCFFTVVAPCCFLGLSLLSSGLPSSSLSSTGSRYSTDSLTLQ